MNTLSDTQSIPHPDSSKIQIQMQMQMQIKHLTLLVTVITISPKLWVTVLWPMKSLPFSSTSRTISSCRDSCLKIKSNKTHSQPHHQHSKPLEHHTCFVLS